MKELLLRVMRYNAWANARFISLLRGLGDDQLDMHIVSSFPSIRKTVLHIRGAEDIWLQRLRRVLQPVWNGLIFNGSIGELCKEWEATSSALISFVESITDEGFFSETIDVVNSKGEHYTDNIGAVLQHVFNHATYHRGQLVTMLRQAGVAVIPATDLIAFTRGL